MGINPNFGSPLPRGMTLIGGGWRDPADAVNRHAGVDIRLNEGTPVFAIGDGVVTSASSTPSGDLGIYAAIAHSSGFVSRYLHFSQLLVAPGQTVRKGQQIGLSGNTGNSAAPHLHLDLKVPDPGVLAQVASAVGTPATGFEGNVTGFGAGVPAEPWIPADSYDPQVVANAQSNGIPLYRPRGLQLVAIAGVGLGLAYAAYRFLFKGPAEPPA